MMKINIRHQIKVVWLFLKCQLITKSVAVFVLYPLYRIIIDFLLQRSGRAVFSSGDFISFLISVNGLGTVVISLILMTLLIGLDINTFIIISSLIQEQVLTIKVRAVLIEGIKSLKKMINPIGLMMMVFVALIFPLLGFITISPMSHFQIPNFITSVIYSNILYSLLYIGLLIGLCYVAMRYIFTFHYVLINNDSLKNAMRNTLVITRKKVWFILKKGTIKSLKRGIVLVIPVIIFSMIIILLLMIGRIGDLATTRFETLLTLITFSEIISFFVFLTSPIMIITLTELFYELNMQHHTSIHFEVDKKFMVEKKPNSRITLLLFGIVMLGIVSFNVVAAGILTYVFDDLFNHVNQIKIVAHRGGGNLGAENTIQGVQEAIRHNIDFTEIDVQRTKDGYYIINHDATFNRLSDIKKSSSEMTLEEIRTLQVKNEFDSSKPAQSVATIEEMIAVSKGKIGLFIELKGKTADTKMVDDMVKLVKEHQLEDAVLLSLDYNIITYIEKNYPEINTGYLYYFALGKIEALQGDYLIMEEREATPENIQRLKEKGKKVIVWTINTQESIDTFVKSAVDGIITDYALDVKAAIDKRATQSDWDNIIDMLFN